MNKNFKKFVSLFTILSMITSLIPVIAADEYQEKMLGSETGEISLYSAVEAYNSDGEMLIDKKSGYSASDFISSSSVTEVGSVAGKPADDTCARVIAKNKDTYFNSGSVTIDMTKYYIFEFNLYAQQNFSSMYFATKSHSALSYRVYNDDLISNSWNKIQLVYNPTAGASNVFVNGVDKGVYDIADSTLEQLNVNKQGFRIVIEPTSSYGDYNTVTVCVDNIRLYSSIEFVRDYPAELTNIDYGKHCADNANKHIYLIGEDNVAQLKDFFCNENIQFAQVLNKGYVMPDSEILKVGFEFVVTDVNNVSNSYTLKAWKENLPVVCGEGARPSNRFTACNLKIHTRTYANNTALSVAQYDREGNIINIATNSYISGGKLICDFDAAALDGSYLKIFVWDSTNTLRPRVPSVTYNYSSRDVNVLFIGSENIISAAKYVRPLALADGIDMGVGILYAEDADYNLQYENMSTEDYNTFIYNGINTGNISFDSLSADKYAWDYVVMQNHIDSYDDMYTSNWTPVASDMVKYINSKLPDARIFVASTAPHQIGFTYSDGDESVVVDKNVFADVAQYLSEQTKNSAGIASLNNNINVRTADIASLYQYIMGTTTYSSSYYDEGHKVAADSGNTTYNAGYGILSTEDKSGGKVTLYADGSHASYAGSILQSMYMYSVLTGGNVTENTYTPVDNYVVECDNPYSADGKISYQFTPPVDSTLSDFERIVAGFDIYGNNQVYIRPKTDGYSPKHPDSIIMDEKFDEYSGSGLGNGWLIEKSSSNVTVQEDTECGGKYLNINTPAASGKVTANKFFEPNGGNVRFDMQLRINNEYGNATFDMFGFNYSEALNRSSSLKLTGNKLYLTDMHQKILELITGQWYNISVSYNCDLHMYDVYVNGRCVASNVSFSNKIRTFECFVIGVPSAGITDIDIDNIRMSHIEPGEFPTYSFVSDVLYDNDFDNYLNNTILKEDAKGTIYAKKENNNGYVWAERVADNGSCSTNFYFPKTNDNVTVEFKVRLDDASWATKVISLQGGITATIYFSGSTLSVLDEANKRPSYVRDITIGEWHSIKLVTKAENNVFEIYFDDMCYTKDAPFQSAGSPAFDNIRFAITSGGASSYALDNLKVTRNNDYKPENVTFEGYSPDNDAPKSYDWQKQFVDAPTGLVYEAEDMKLHNYAQLSDDSYNGGSGVSVEGTGYGTAEFTFNGESGYYAINVGYGESDGNFDSFYDLKQNGKRIDWWIGQYDDNVHHVRNTRRYHYVAKGDSFRIIGKGGSDPSKLDYVEFASAEALEEFTYGDLIEDDGTHPGMWRSSSWDATEEGGYVRKGKTVYDCRTDAKCELIRNIYPIDSSFVFDYSMYVSSASDCVVKIGDGVTFPVWYKFGNKTITIGETSYSNAYSNHSTKLFRIAVDTRNKTYTIVINGVVLAQDIPFDGDVEKFSQIRVESSDAGTCNFSMSNAKLSAGYDVFETFRPYSAGSVPYDWEIAEAESANMYSEGNDTKSLRINANGVAKKVFEPISGKITFETNFILPQAKNDVYLHIGSGSSYIGFYTKNGKIYYDTNKGFDRALWDNYKSNIWYTLRIELDTETKKADFIINDFKKAENVTVNLTSVDNVKFDSGSNEGYLWIDDVTVVNDIYTTSVPEPQVPELKDDYTIVMECCDLWREGNHFGNYSYSPFDNRIPLLGYLEDGNLEVAEWETKFMAEHGITTYVPCWYTNINYNNSPVKEPRNSAKLHAFLKSEYCQQLDFAILVTVVSGSGGVDGFFNNYVNYWIERYFKAPNYWKIDNKPVIPVYDVNSVNNIGGGQKDSTAEIIRRIDEVLIENGFDGGIYIGTDNNNITTTLNGYDYKYRYHMGTSPVGTTVISSLLNNQSTDDVGYIASPSQGWGNEAWGREDRKYNIPLSDWYGSLKWIRDVYMPGQNASSLTSNTIWLGNWNEYSEGHSLAPSRIAGFGYLDGVRKVFTNGSTDHVDELPDKYFDRMTAITWK